MIGDIAAVCAVFRLAETGLAELIDEFVAQITALGPSPLRAEIPDEVFAGAPIGDEVTPTELEVGSP